MGTSLTPSTATHFLHLWHRPCISSLFSSLPTFVRSMVRNAVGGENGRPVEAEMPSPSELEGFIRARKQGQRTMCVLHVIAVERDETVDGRKKKAHSAQCVSQQECETRQ